MLEAALAGVFGLLIGSFLNVCIYRFPRDLSVVRPRSFCPECYELARASRETEAKASNISDDELEELDEEAAKTAAIAWYDNIPLVSFLLLKGRCRHCGKSISARYPIVEALTAASFFSFVAVLGLTLPALKFCLLSALLLGMIFADLEQLILPDEFTLGGVAAGLALSWVIPVSDGTAQILFSIIGLPLNTHALSLAESALGAAIPAGFLWLTGEVYQRLRHKEGLGFGDVKMVAAIGAFLGLHNTLLTLIAGSLLGSVVGLVYILATRKDHASYPLPFGTFLGIGALGVSLVDQKVIAWYARLF
jgi:leader peptidase (prepilin peptidase)/N-methyltransferase